MKFLSILSASSKAKAIKQAMPSFIPPMLATLTDTYFSDPQWIYEHKWDGYRILAFKQGNTIRLITRNNIIRNDSFPLVVEALKKIKVKNFILDGEVIAQDENQLATFSLLQRKSSAQLAKLPSIAYCIFDLLYIDSYDITNLPLMDRKLLLESHFKFSEPLRVTEYIEHYGELLLKEACKHKWEGIIAKDKTSIYEKKRSTKWLKFKCRNQQEFVIGGYTLPEGLRTDFGALLLGYYSDGEFMYAGRVGTGFNDITLETLGAQLRKLEQKKCPFDVIDTPVTDTIRWVKPKLIAEVQFAEWTITNKLRHASFKRLRADKDPKEIIREEPS